MHGASTFLSDWHQGMFYAFGALLVEKYLKPYVIVTPGGSDSDKAAPKAPAKS